MKQNITELIGICRPVFDRIRQAIWERNEGEFYRLLDTDQPGEWITTVVSKLQKVKEIPEFYQLNTISLSDAIIAEIFTSVETNIEGLPHFLFDKGKCAVTTKVISVFKNSLVTIRKEGIATVYASSLNHLELVTPLSFTRSRKHAIKQLGTFLGKSLNRDIEDKEGDEDTLPEETPLDKLKKLLEEKRDKLTPDLLVDAERIINENEIVSFEKLVTKLSIL